jgi:hypothetical protein
MAEWRCTSSEYYPNQQEYIFIKPSWFLFRYGLFFKYLVKELSFSLAGYKLTYWAQAESRRFLTDSNHPNIITLKICAAFLTHCTIYKFKVT